MGSITIDEIPDAIDLSHHINARSKARHPSPLKDIIKYMNADGMISLAGGLPHPSLFPIHEAIVTASSPSGLPKPNKLVQLELSNAPSIDPPLSKFLQYGNCWGNDALREWCLEFTKRVCSPGYKDFEILLHPGNTNGWRKVVDLLCEEGEYILCEAFTYPSAQALWIPEGYLAAPIAMDGEGIRDDALEELIETWEETHPGKRRPHVLYTVSVGSNPSGVTMGARRRQKIYKLAVKYDFIIVEDDPYYFLQFPPFEINRPSSTQPLSNTEFISSLAPSFLTFDTQGRVIRLDSFSKTLAPGLRLGYFVANSVFIERLLRATEIETQDPSGVSQAITLALLQKWGMDGYITWLQNLRLQYQARRDWMIDNIAKYFVLQPASEIPKASGGNEAVPIFSFVPPTGGMFIWTEFYFSQNRRFREIQADASVVDPEQTFADELWKLWIDALILVTPGSYYHPWQGEGKKTTKARGAAPETSNFRLTFAMASMEDMEEGIARFAEVIKESWGL